jgi:hypothetical protein
MTILTAHGLLSPRTISGQVRLIHTGCPKTMVEVRVIITLKVLGPNTHYYCLIRFNPEDSLIFFQENILPGDFIIVHLAEQKLRFYESPFNRPIFLYAAGSQPRLIKPEGFTHE